MIVVDASVLATALADDGDDGRRCRGRLSGESLAAPEIIDLEVCSVLRKLVLRGELTSRRAGAAVRDLADLPLRRVGHQSLIGRVWELRRNLTSYDASYIALAETLSVPLLTGDARMASAPGIRCAVERV